MAQGVVFVAGVALADWGVAQAALVMVAGAYSNGVLRLAVIRRSMGLGRRPLVQWVIGAPALLLLGGFVVLAPLALGILLLAPLYGDWPRFLHDLASIAPLAAGISAAGVIADWRILRPSDGSEADEAQEVGGVRYAFTLLAVGFAVVGRQTSGDALAAAIIVLFPLLLDVTRLANRLRSE